MVFNLMIYIRIRRVVSGSGKEGKGTEDGGWKILS
jgi:hypothetical protein